MLQYLVGFSIIPEIGPRSFQKLESFFNNIEEAWKANEQNLEKAGLKPKTVKSIIQKRNSLDLKKELEKIRKEEIIPISRKLNFQDFSGFNQKWYPETLSQIPDPPFLIFCKGNLKLLNKTQVAVVGSRKPTHYGEQVVDKIITDLAYSGLVITSGMAMGIDSLAHKAVLETSSPTIAVLGNGLSQKTMQKSVNFRLSEKILSQDGLIVSEYPPDMPANKFTFPARNRIISGLSKGVLVVEAGNRSGTLITASHALDQNREIFAVPGNIFSPQSAGTNQLIHEGAHPIVSAENILQQLGWQKQPAKGEKTNISFQDKIEEKIYQTLDHEPQPVDKIASRCKLDISEVSVKLSIMEIKGIAQSKSGGFTKKIQ
jgi:DNA processing protein